MIFEYKEPDSFSIIIDDEGKDECVKDSATENALNIFLNATTPTDSIYQIKIITNSIKSSNKNYKTYILSRPLIPRVILLINSFSEINSQVNPNFCIPFEFSSASLIVELIESILSEKPEFRNPQTLKFCIDFLNQYFEKEMFPNLLTPIHFLMRSIKFHMCKENISLFDETFFLRISRFIIYSSEIQIDLSEFAEMFSLFLPEVSRKYQYFFDFLNILYESSNSEASYHISLTLKNIIQKHPHFISNKQSWPYQAVVLFSNSYNIKTQSVSFEILGILSHKDILYSLMRESNVKNSIKSVITQSDISDIRVIPVIHALTHFLEIDPLKCSEIFITKNKSEKFSPHFINYVINGPFQLKVDAGHFLSKCIIKNPSMFKNGLSEDVFFHYRSKIGQLKNAILTVLEIEDEKYKMLLASMVEALLAICQECQFSCGLDELMTIRSELESSGILDKIDEIMNNCGSDEIKIMCRKIFECFEEEEEKDFLF